MARRRSHGGWSHWAAPTAFLAGVTIAVVLVASALRGGDSTPASATTAKGKPASTRAARAKTTRAANGRRYYTVVAGDSFGTIASKTGTSVTKLEVLNPGISSTSLHVGQRIRVG